MSLTMGRGPFGHKPGGVFNFQPPDHVVFVDDFPRRVRAVKDGLTVVDSDRVKLVHQSRRLPYYAFPAADVSIDAADEPLVQGHVTIPWDAVDAWFEEDDEVFVHPRDPYHRIDTARTSRHVRVSVAGTVLADSTAAVALYETGLPVRYYLPGDDVVPGVLEPSPTVTACAYKGRATHWSARLADRVVDDVAWSYDGDDVRREAEDVRGRVCFYNERVDLDVDGARQERPWSPWSR
jgi:uncharacterized protein (DUF427 family)